MLQFLGYADVLAQSNKILHLLGIAKLLIKTVYLFTVFSLENDISCFILGNGNQGWANPD